MKRLFAITSALMLATASVVSAAKPVDPPSFIWLETPPPYQFQSVVYFGTEINEKITGQERPLIYLECFAVTDGVKLTGQLRGIDDAYSLGGSSSRWFTRPNDDANCVAHLYVYGGKPYAIEIAEPVEFFAEGQDA